MATQTKTKSKKTEAKPDLLNVAFVWDMSGSMGSVEGSTREATAAYLLDLQKEERKLVRKHGAGVYTRLSLTIFDTEFEEWAVTEPIADIDVVELIRGYRPRGGTALYDAIANTIAKLDSGSSKSDKNLLIIMTDGQENSSQEYSLRTDGRARLLKLIKRMEKKGNWTIVYLGANVDAYAEAGAIGIYAGNTVSYSSTEDSVTFAAASMAPMTQTLRGSKGMSSGSLVSDAGVENDYRDEDDKKTSGLWTPQKKGK